MQVIEYKVSLIGQSNSGKTLFLERLLNGTNQIENLEYKPTLGVEVSPIDLNGDFGKIRLNIWDCAADSRYRGLKDQYHLDTQGALIFRKNNDNSYLEFENELPSNIPKLYINDYNLNNPEKTVEQYKQLLYQFITDI